MVEAVPWVRDDLDLGLMYGNARQFWPMLSKLHAGHAITVLAMGSSITQDQAGCFHTGPVSGLAAKIGAKDMPRWVNTYKEMLEDGSCMFNAGSGLGWGTSVMQVINASFPHPNHTFVNAGRAGAALKGFANLACLDDFLPASLDLLILENLGGWTDGKVMEQLIWRIFDYYNRASQPRPAIISLVAARVTEPFQEPEDTICLKNHTRCSEDCKLTFNHTLGPPHFHSEEEAQLTSLAAYYGLTHYSHRTFLFLGATSWAIPQRYNMSLCAWLATLHSDTIHLAPMGRKLFMHYILHALSNAEAKLEHYLQQHHLTGTLQHLPLPEHELFPQGRRIRDMWCPVLKEEAWVPEDRAQAAALGSGSLALARVVSGWRYVQRQVDQRPQHRHKYKPGWVATTVGAKLRVLVSAMHRSDNCSRHAASAPSHSGAPSHRSRPQHASRQLQEELMESRMLVGNMPQQALHRQGCWQHFNTTLSVSYLTSYEHMGTARITCVSGCKCNPTTVDAHCTFKQSIVYTVDVLVTPAPVCELEVEVLPETSSGEHKWKLVAVVGSVALPGTEVVGEY